MSCVPLQLLLTNYMGSTESNRTFAIGQLVSQAAEIRASWLRLEPWKVT